MSDFETEAKARAHTVAQAAVERERMALEQAAQRWRDTGAHEVYERAFAAHMKQERAARDTEVINARMDAVFARADAGTLTPEDKAYAKRILDATREIE